MTQKSVPNPVVLPVPPMQYDQSWMSKYNRILSGQITKILYQLNNGANLFSYIFQPVADNTYTYAQPITGFSLTVGPESSGFILEPAGTLATGTIIMPKNIPDGMIVNVSTTKAITTLTVSPNTGQTVTGAPTTLASGGVFHMRFRASNSTWYPF